MCKIVTLKYKGMIRVVVYITIFVISTFFSIITAQTTVKKPCSSIEYSQFDFWVGNWNVYNDKGALIGVNNIVKMTNACTIQENWTSKTSKSKGTSYNYFNKIDNSWNQVWIDNSGFSLILKGKFEKGKMILNSEIIKSKKGSYRNQIIWEKKKDNSVVQIWNYINENGKVIKEVFKGLYKKREE